MSEEQMRIAASKLIKVDADKLNEYSKQLQDIDAMYYWNPERGGLAVIINTAGEKLVATSAIDFDRHYIDFKNGRRN